MSHSDLEPTPTHVVEIRSATWLKPGEAIAQVVKEEMFDGYGRLRFRDLYVVKVPVAQG